MYKQANGYFKLNRNDVLMRHLRYKDSEYYEEKVTLLIYYKVVKNPDHIIMKVVAMYAGKNIAAASYRYKEEVGTEEHVTDHLHYKETDVTLSFCDIKDGFIKTNSAFNKHTVELLDTNSKPPIVNTYSSYQFISWNHSDTYNFKYLEDKS